MENFSPGRAHILDAALEVLAQEGPGRMTVRKVAEAAGCSTTGVYTYFGGKQGLLDALSIEGYRLLDAETSEPVTDDPLRDVIDGLLLYREFARAHVALYLLMFGSKAQGYTPGPDALAAGRASLATFGASVARAASLGYLDGDPEWASFVLWGAAHGYVMLELTGPSVGAEEAARALRDGIGAMLGAWNPR